MACTLSNKCAKNLSKQTVLLQLIIKNVVTCFFWNTVYIYIAPWRPKTQRCSEDKRAKPSKTKAWYSRLSVPLCTIVIAHNTARQRQFSLHSPSSRPTSDLRCGQVEASVCTWYYSMWHYNCLWSLKGYGYLPTDSIMHSWTLDVNWNKSESQLNSSTVEDHKRLIYENFKDQTNFSGLSGAWKFEGKILWISGIRDFSGCMEILLPVITKESWESPFWHLKQVVLGLLWISTNYYQQNSSHWLNI